MHARALSIAALTLGLITALPAAAADKVLDRTFQVAAGGRLRVDLDAGRVVVTGTDRPQVVVRLSARGTERELAKLEWSAEKDAAGVAVTSKRDRTLGWLGWFNGDANVVASIEVPREYNVELYTSGGGIELRGIDGDALGRTSGGRLQIEAVRGKVEMRTSGGGVTLKSVQGPVSVQTSGGSIQASDLEGGLRAHTSGGSIRLDRVSGPIEVHTSGGSIDVDLVGDNQGIVARTSGGSINLRIPSSIAGTLNASTSGGRVKSELPVTIGESGDSVLRGTINGGGPEIMARSSGGSISIASRDARAAPSPEARGPE